MSDRLLYAWLPDTPIHLDDAQADPKLLWKVVLRTGTWKLRPGPGGVKLNQPLKIYRDKAPKGHISMAELVKNFDAGAKEYVTVPQVHADGTTSDGGFVRKLVIQDVPGENGSKAKESLLWAGLEITDSALKTKLDEKSLRGVSGGILFDYQRTEDAKKFGQILSHVMVTNSPWINGTGDFQSKLPDGVMADESTDLLIGEVEFSARETDPLPELPVVRLGDPPMATSSPSAAAGKVLWKPEQGFRFAQDKIRKALRDWRDAVMSSVPVEQRYTLDWPYFSVDDVSLSGDSGSALITSGYGSESDAWVAKFKLNSDREAEIDPFAQWEPAKQEWVAASEETVSVFLSASDLDELSLADTAEQRRQWAKEGKALPDGSWPIPNQAYLSKAVQAWPGRAQGQVARIKAWILKRARALGVSSDSPMLARLNSSSSNMSESASPAGRSLPPNATLRGLGLREAQRARSERTGLGDTSITTGGHTVGRISDLLSRDDLQLSDEDREVLRAEERRLAGFEESEADRLKTTREAEVVAYCGSPDGQTQGVLDKIGLGDPGVKKYVRNALLSDDGGAAIELSEHLADGRKTQGETKTATELLKGFIDILPKGDEGRVSLAQQARRVPDDTKPPDENEDDKLDLSAEAVTKRADALAAELAAEGFAGTQMGGSS